jgi:hypothetical protein
MELIKTALIGLAVSTESIKTDPAAETQVPRAITPAAQAQVALDRAKQDGTIPTQVDGLTEKQGVVMTGPLGVIMTRALNIAYAKKDPATGEYTATADSTAPTPEDALQGEVASLEEYITTLETQANDWIMAAAALREKKERLTKAGINPEEDSGDAEDVMRVPLTTSGTRAIEVTPDEVVRLFQNPELLPNKGSCDFVFYTDTMAPSHHAPMGVGASYTDNRTLYMDGSAYQVSVESISIVVKTRTDKIAPAQ